MDGVGSVMMLAFSGSINNLLQSMESLIPLLLKETSKVLQDIANTIKQCVNNIKETFVKAFNSLIEVIKECLTKINVAIETAIKWKCTTRICKILDDLSKKIGLVLQLLLTALPLVALVHSCMALVDIFSTHKEIDAKNYNRHLTRIEQNITRIFNKLLDTCEEAAMEKENSCMIRLLNRRIGQGEEYRRKINLIYIDLDYEVNRLRDLEKRIKDDLKKVEMQREKTAHSAPIKFTAGGILVGVAAFTVAAPVTAIAAVIWGVGTGLDIYSYRKSRDKKGELDEYLNRAETAWDDSRQRLREKSEAYIAELHMEELNELVKEYKDSRN